MRPAPKTLLWRAQQTNGFLYEEHVINNRIAQSYIVIQGDVRVNSDKFPLEIYSSAQAVIRVHLEVFRDIQEAPWKNA